MRQRREALRLTVREVALKAGLRESSASYISQLESGAKTPHPALGRRLAEALRDDPRIYLAWAATGKRSDPVETTRAIHVLSAMLGHPRYAQLDARESAAWTCARPSQTMTDVPAGRASVTGEALIERLGVLPEMASRPRPATSDPRVPDEPLEQAQPLLDAQVGYHRALTRELPPLPVTPPPAETPQAKILVPEIEEGADPGEDTRSNRRVLAMHRIAAASLAGIEPPVRPFAFRVTATGARRVADLLAPGDLAIVSRSSWPLERFTPHVVRLSGHLIPSRIVWNGRQLLLLPGWDASDFMVLDAPDRTTLDRLIAGKVVARIRGRG